MRSIFYPTECSALLHILSNLLPVKMSAIKMQVFRFIHLLFARRLGPKYWLAQMLMSASINQVPNLFNSRYRPPAHYKIMSHCCLVMPDMTACNIDLKPKACFRKAMGNETISLEWLKIFLKLGFGKPFHFHPLVAVYQQPKKCGIQVPTLQRIERFSATQ